MYWVDNNGASYGPFDTQEDGYPNAGQVLRYFRKLRHVSAKELAEQLGDVSTRWIYIMEKENKVYESINRRSALAFILGIPPILLGLGDIKELETQSGIRQETTKELDITALDNRLDFIYEAFNAGIDSRYLRPQLNSAIYALSTSREKDALTLLSKYYRSYSRIERDMQNMELAKDYIKKAEAVSSELNDIDLFSISMHSHGWILEEDGDILKSIPYIRKGHDMVKNDITPLAGCSYIDLAIILSTVTQDRKDRDLVESLLDRAEEIATEVPSTREKDGMLTMEVVHTNRAKAYLNMRMLDKAEYAIEKSESCLAPNQTRRSIRLDIIQAKYSFLSGDIMIALNSLENAYKAAKYIKSYYNISTIRQLAHDIRNSRYISMREVKIKIATMFQ